VLFALLAAAAAAAAVAYPAGYLSLVALLAAVPGVVLSVTLAVRPPAPARLRTVGWALVSISALTAVALILGLRGG
jgi:hypothetical protein